MNKDIDKIIKLIEDYQQSIGRDQLNYQDNYEAFKEYNAQLMILQTLKQNILLMGYGWTPKNQKKKKKKG